MCNFLNQYFVFGVIIGLALAGFFSAQYIDAGVYSIPPTRAFMKIFSGSENVTADRYNANVTFTSSGNVDIQMFYNNNTIKFHGDTPTLALEDLTNVTDAGCAVGQARTVSGGGIWVCSNIGTGDVTGAANVGTGTGTIFRDETAGTLNLKTLKEGANISITNNADDITITAAAGTSGYTKINNLDGGDAKIIATNTTLTNTQATFKTLTAGSGISITNGTKTITITATSSSTLKVDNQTVARKGWLVGLNNATGDWTSRTFALNNQTYNKPDIHVIGVNNQTGVVTTAQFSVNNVSTTCSGSDKVSSVSINNATGNVIITCSAVTASGGATSLGANVTGTLPGTDYLVFTIPLTANSGNTVSGVLTATSSVSGTAVRAGANVTNLNTRGWCHWEHVSTTTANTYDNIVMNTVSTGRVTNTGETAWIGAAQAAMPITFHCSVKTGPTAGNLRVFITPEVSGATIEAKAGSYYLKTP